MMINNPSDRTADGTEDSLERTLTKRWIDVRERVSRLHQQAEGSTQPGLLTQTFEELHAMIEELRVVEEEMRVQNDELLLTRQHVEAERQRYQDLFEFAPDSYLVTTVDGQIREANRAAAKLLGIAPRFLQKRSLSAFVVPQDLTAFSARLRTLGSQVSAVPADGPSDEWVVRLRRRPSTTFLAALTASPYPALLNEPATLRWLIRDITERHQAEEERLAIARTQAANTEAEAGQQRLSGILDTITDQFVTFDTGWRFASLNASAARLVRAAGKDPEALIGQVIWEAYPTALGTAFQTEALRAVSTGQPVQFEEFSHGLSRWLHVRVFPSESGVVVYAHDVTERKAASASLQAAHDKEQRIAETLQRILLHTVPADSCPGLEIETFYEAASEEALIGGDFFDVFRVRDGIVALVVGDVSGKGLAAAALTAQVKYALRTILRDVREPGPALARLNDFLCEAQQQGDLGSDHLVALALALVDPQTGALSFATAGSESLMLLRENGEVDTADNDNLLLGVQPGRIYTEREAVLATGDRLLLLTDGLTEARRDNTLLGFEALTARAAEAQNRPTLREMGDDLLGSIRAWAGGTFQDDVCLLIARRTL